MSHDVKGRLDAGQVQQFREVSRRLEDALISFHSAYSAEMAIAERARTCVEHIEDSLGQFLRCSNAEERYGVTEKFLRTQAIKIVELEGELWAIRAHFLALAESWKRDLEKMGLADQLRSQVEANLDAVLNGGGFNTLSAAADVLAGGADGGKLDSEAFRVRILAQYDQAVKNFTMYTTAFGSNPPRGKFVAPAVIPPSRTRQGLPLPPRKTSDLAARPARLQMCDIVSKRRTSSIAASAACHFFDSRPGEP